MPFRSEHYTRDDPLLNGNSSLKYYEATTFVESYFLGTIKGKLLFMFLHSSRRAIAHFTERDGALEFLEVPLLQLILPKIHRSKTVPLKHFILFIINCMLDSINVSEEEIIAKCFSRHAIF